MYNRGTTDLFFLMVAAVIVRLFAQDTDSCVIALCCGVYLVVLQ